MRNNGLFSSLFIDELKDTIELEDVAQGRMATLAQTWRTRKTHDTVSLWDSFLKQALSYLEFVPPGNGRHCEIVISAHRLANPQWTPFEAAAPEWMKLGFQLFSALKGLVTVYEVFPTASYALLQGNTDIRINADFSACQPGPKDMLDAWVAAVTVREFVEGRGTEVGGGDGLGTIILPCPQPEPVIDAVMEWPG